MFPQLTQTIHSLAKHHIQPQRQKELLPFRDYIQEKIKSKEAIQLNFICTHNSRRSHLAQVWAQTLANWFKLPNVTCYSGGTEETAMFPKVAETLQNQGFQVLKLSQEPNPVYALKFDSVTAPVICFSKSFAHPYNPTTNFAAILTCDSADAACPMVPGAERRFPIKYADPKAFDGTDLQASKYAERSLEIAGELYWIFNQLVLE